MKNMKIKKKDKQATFEVAASNSRILKKSRVSSLFIFVSKCYRCFFFFFLFFFFFKFLQVKSEFCSRSSLNAGKTETTGKQLFKNTKLEIASKMMMMENGNEQITKKHENKMTIDLF